MLGRRAFKNVLLLLQRSNLDVECILKAEFMDCPPHPIYAPPPLERLRFFGPQCSKD